MKNIEIRVIRRAAIDRGRRISNATISLILSFIVTAAAQTERINHEGRVLGPVTVTLRSIADHVKEKNETAVMTLVSGNGYKIPKRSAKVTLTILNGP